MLSSLLRPKRGRRRSSATPLLFKGFQAFRNATPSGEETGSEDEDEYEDGEQYEEDDIEEEDEDELVQPILPIFSAPVLGMSAL